MDRETNKGSSDRPGLGAEPPPVCVKLYLNGEMINHHLKLNCSITMLSLPEEEGACRLGS